MATALTADELKSALQTLPGWCYHRQALERVVECPSYRAGLDLLRDIGELAERENHHPDLMLNYRRLTVRYWTHTAGGVTGLDVRQAAQAEALIARAVPSALPGRDAVG